MYFNIVLNRPPSAIDDAIDMLTQVECNAVLYEFPMFIKLEKQFNNCHLTKLQLQMLGCIRLVTSHG